MKSITMSIWEAAAKLGVEEWTLNNLANCIPHIILANERLFPRRYIEMCMRFLKDYNLPVDHSNMLLFRDMSETIAIIRETEIALGLAFRSDPCEKQEKQELSAQAVADILGVAIPTIDRWRIQGHLPKGMIPKITLSNAYSWAFPA